MTVPNQVVQNVQPPSNDEQIAGFAKSVLQDITQNEDPEQTDAGLLSDGEVEQQAETGEQPEGEEVQAETEEVPPQVPEVPMFELELEDGEKVNVPEKLKGYFMRDKDYRQKTMALAEQRKSFEQLSQQAQQIAVQAQQMAPYHAQLYAMDNHAQGLQQQLTAELATNDPIEYNRKQGELAILLRNRDSLAAGLHQQVSYLYQQQAQLKSQRLAVEAPKLFEEIPDLGKPEERESLAKWLRGQGLSDEEFAHVDFSVAATRLAWKAKQYDKLIADQANAKKALKAKVATVPPVAKSTRSPNGDAQVQQARKDWKKGGGKYSDPNFSTVLRSRIGVK